SPSRLSSQSHALPGFAFPPVGRLGLASPRSSVLCSATTASCPSWVASLPLAPQYLGCSLALCPFSRLTGRRELAASAGALGQPVPLFFRPSVPRRHGALPSSRVLPVTPCPALRPRWGPGRIALARLGLLPSARSTASALATCLAVSSYPLVHDYTHFGARSHGLASCSLRLRTPLTGLHAEFATELLASGFSI